MQLGLIGYPLEHSRSPEIFARFFDEANIKGHYKLYPIEDVGQLKSWLKTQPYIQGLNVTIPHKKTIIPLLDSISEEAATIGSVNTVIVRVEGNNFLLSGHNTDYFGFRTTLEDFLVQEKPQRALILGTGGASNTVAYTLAQMGIEGVKVSRHSSDETPLTYDDLAPQTIQSYQLIINTTPMGMYPSVRSFPQIPYEALTAHHYLYDLVYNPIDTLFLQKGRAMGAKTHNGLAMLELQARKSWELFLEG